MNISKNLYRDVTTGLLFVTGILSFMSGEFVLSTMFFGAASISSNLEFAGTVRA